MLQVNLHIGNKNKVLIILIQNWRINKYLPVYIYTYICICTRVCLFVRCVYVYVCVQKDLSINIIKVIVSLCLQIIFMTLQRYYKKFKGMGNIRSTGYSKPRVVYSKNKGIVYIYHHGNKHLHWVSSKGNKEICKRICKGK